MNIRVRVESKVAEGHGDPAFLSRGLGDYLGYKPDFDQRAWYRGLRKGNCLRWVDNLRTTILTRLLALVKDRKVTDSPDLLVSWMSASMKVTTVDSWSAIEPNPKIQTGTSSPSRWHEAPHRH